jgi:hypothetical protein
MRLETPVIYFYPPKGAKLPMTVDVEVKFRGGWLTEFYPRPEVHFPVVENGKFEFTNLTPQTTGEIAWRNLLVGTDRPGPETNEHVWLAPRNVAAANLTSTNFEHEKYLFYRGVARQFAPLRAVTENDGQSLSLSGSFRNLLKENQRSSIQNIWLMETLRDGRCAYRRLPAIPVVNDKKELQRIAVSRRFSETEFDSSNRQRIEAEMDKTLLAEGLFADEARALLSTWQQAYFTSPGLRLFYTVPREWTDYYLPLTISGNPQITRVMIGRIELISDAQRGLLNRLAQTPVSKGDWLSKFQNDPVAVKQLLSGQKEIEKHEQDIPQDFQLYLDLGRFRNALVAAEEKRTRSANLAQFIRENRLEPFRLAQESGK